MNIYFAQNPCPVRLFADTPILKPCPSPAIFMQKFALRGIYLCLARGIIGDMNSQTRVTALIAASVFMIASVGCTAATRNQARISYAKKQQRLHRR
jgi:predicted Zn-dependent protease